MNRPFIDSHGVLRGFPYHDGTLQALVLVEGRAMIGVRSTAGDRHVIDLRGVTALSAEGIREGNIILGIRVLRPAQVADDPPLAQLVLERLGVPGITDLDPHRLVFHLESSYGAEVLASCTEWSVAPGGFELVPT